MESKDGSKKKGSMRKKVPYFIVPADAPKFIQMPGLETTILTGLHGEKMMMVLNDTLPGHSVPLHSHPNEQVGIVYAGKAKLRIGDEERIVQKGDFYRIPANIPHGDTCIGDEPFVMLDIFYPVRDDFIEKLKQSSDAQSKKERMKMSKENLFPEIITGLPEADIPIEGLQAHLFQGENQQFVFMAFEKDVEISEHSHEAQWGVVLDGEIELTIDGENHTFKKGDTYFIPKGVKHSARIRRGYKDLTLFDQMDRYKTK